MHYAGTGGGVVGSSPTWLLLNKFTYPVRFLSV